ncbi:thymidylate kinase [Microbacterium phage Coltrane]|uniref:Thymidylate kinase n=6 Tax=Armstrongvirus armstrong TaxID=2734217 RepID=A0A3G2KD23_9CAUD|nr:thymidylate kinase [Microbacterium phage Armstrong]AYN55900.1 thymidylate kinase [Microbacterium phage Brahms]AYN57006.1 thymidylate kinase [Microbacterium phage Bernstein]AYN57365.1 thymidylate kinase [Microbacterium phage Coltrane]AYN58953.1 thymidylate kinase [Microbacterium phage Rollins]QED11452.1 thymidylate kinase [Microbacterium phage Vitas]UGL61996.1 thymidylate kinase [Microbacterium phage Skylord]UOK18183.1 thymidylate kinase [Microbacterium phage Clayda5]
MTTDAQIILLEGADGTGKTTFISRMAQMHLDGGTAVPRVIHNTADDRLLPGSLYRHYYAQLVDAVEFRANGISTYIDRSFLSELIYGRLYRGKARLTERQVRKLERLATDADIILLGMTTDLAVRRARVQERGEEFDRLQPFVGAFYSQHFSERSKYWITADSTSAPVLN